MKAEAKKNSKKIIIGVLSCCLVAVLGVGGTLAFLTDRKEVANRFKMGDLKIDLDEPSWNDGDDPDNGDGRNLRPGDTRDKDPTVYAVTNDSYMRVVMMIKDAGGETITDKDRLDLILTTIRYAENNAIEEGKHYLIKDIGKYPRINPKFDEDTARSEPGIYYYNYKGVFEEDDRVVLFTDIVVPGDWENAEIDTLGSYKIVLEAQAIQTEGFNSAEAAFAALDGEIEKEDQDSADKEFEIVQRTLTV